MGLVASWFPVHWGAVKKDLASQTKGVTKVQGTCIPFVTHFSKHSAKPIFLHTSKSELQTLDHFLTQQNFILLNGRSMVGTVDGERLILIESNNDKNRNKYPNKRNIMFKDNFLLGITYKSNYL